MIRRFPRDQAFVERTHLRYVHLDNVLTDSKVDRAARVPGFVGVFLGDETELIFLLDGEPVTAARVAPAGRCVLPVAAVVERARAEVERADVAYYGAAEGQLRAMYATMAGAPLSAPSVADLGNPRHLFEELRRSGIDAILELVEQDAVHYLVLDAGQPVTGYLAGRHPASPLRDELPRLFEPARRHGMVASLYPAVAELPVQAPKALVDLYARTVEEAIRGTAPAVGMEAALALFEGALVATRARHPALAGFGLAPDGRVLGLTAASAEPLTEGVATWVFEGLMAAERAGGPDPARLLAEVTRDTRFALQAQGFFQRLPWAVVW
jgi:hypothetical protein